MFCIAQMKLCMMYIVPEETDPCGCSVFPCLQRLPSPARFVQTTASTLVLLHLPASADWDCASTCYVEPKTVGKKNCKTQSSSTTILSSLQLWTAELHLMMPCGV